MGNSLAVIPFPGDISQSSIAELWGTKICDREAEEAADIIIKSLKCIITGVHLGINMKPDYINLYCSEPRRSRILDLLVKNEEMKGINIHEVDEGIKISLPERDIATGVDLTEVILISGSPRSELAFNLCV